MHVVKACICSQSIDKGLGLDTGWKLEGKVKVRGMGAKWSMVTNYVEYGMLKTILRSGTKVV